MIVEVRPALQAIIEDLKYHHGKIDIEINGFRIDRTTCVKGWVQFFNENVLVLEARVGSTVHMKVWKEIIS